jgi:hypothetical protein
MIAIAKNPRLFRITADHRGQRDQPMLLLLPKDVRSISALLVEMSQTNRKPLKL